MPELPDITIYVEALARRVHGVVLEAIRLKSIFLLRSAEPPVSAVEGRPVTGVRRLGKRIVLAFEQTTTPHFLVLHLMKAGRLHWKARGAGLKGRANLCAMDFATGTVVVSEAGKKRRASLHVVRGYAALGQHDPGGLEVLGATLTTFQHMLRSENHTLKRALTDPRLFAGIGSAYADEILHRARLSPVQLTGRLGDAETARLHAACRDVLGEWTERLREEVGEGWPARVTAFREGMAVHGRYGQPCPVCGDPVQRIVYAETETNYCATCQTAGRLLKDRALSRLLRRDWPRTLTEMEERGRRR